jgi:hypothetical protein
MEEWDVGSRSIHVLTLSDLRETSIFLCVTNNYTECHGGFTEFHGETNFSSWCPRSLPFLGEGRGGGQSTKVSLITALTFLITLVSSSPMIFMILVRSIVLI